MRRDARGGVTRHVADVVRTGAARAEPEIDHLLDDVDRMPRRDLAQLQIGAGRHVRIAAGAARGEIGHGGELPMVEDPVMDPHAQHVGILRRRHVEQPVVAPTEIVRRLRKLVFGCLLLEAMVGVERMLVAFPLLLVDELLAGGLGLRHRGEMRRVRPGRHRRTRAAAGRLQPSDLDARCEPFEIALLLGREFTAHDGPSLKLSLPMVALASLAGVRPCGARQGPGRNRVRFPSKRRGTAIIGKGPERSRTSE